MKKNDLKIYDNFYFVEIHFRANVRTLSKLFKGINIIKTIYVYSIDLDIEVTDRASYCDLFPFHFDIDIQN